MLTGAAIAYATQHLNIADVDEFYRKLFDVLDRYRAVPLTLPLLVELTDEQRGAAARIVGLLHQAYRPASPEVPAMIGLIDDEQLSSCD